MKLLISDYPDAASAYSVLGVVQASSGNFDEAATSLGKAIALDPSLAEAHHNLGLVHCRRGDFGAAAERFRAAVQLNPSNDDAQVNLGNALRELGALEEASTAYRRAIEIGGSRQADVHYNLGLTLADLGRLEEAVASFSRAIAIQPGHVEAHLNLSRALRGLDRHEESLASLRRLAGTVPNSPDVQITFGNALRDAGRLEESTVAYRKALELRPGDRQASYHLGLALLDLGRHAEGLEIISRGPGIAQVSVAGGASDSRPQPRRVALATEGGPSFIGCWFLPDPDICQQIIDFFESQSALHVVGRTGKGVDRSIKNSTDLTILPADLDQPSHAAIATYLRQLEACYRDYAAQWPHFGQTLPRAGIVPFTIQRYREGGHFQRPHSERMSFGFIHRVLAWMTYLNDVDGGGETRFHHFGLNVRPERGKTLIWPAEWTHMHAGEVVTAGTKYIITGWMHFPHESALERRLRA